MNIEPRTKQNVEARARLIIAEQLGHAEADVTPEERLATGLGADSLDFIELVMALEDDFGIEIPDDDAEKIGTVQEVFDYLATRLNVKGE